MVLSKVIELDRTATRFQTSLDRQRAAATELDAFHQLIDRATATGWLNRQDEDVILAAILKDSRYTVEKCELFRRLQERVWQAEVYLES